ncbi:MAG TPA: hypothetical protein VK209_05920, partial [Candidatus Sulfotelmatobacter sp.]|nr:hypothetical protein [Candidatus Sulfotelmatobacter sp.]
MKPNEPISKEEARKLCSEIRAEKGIKIFSQCWGCLRFSKGNVTKICFSNKLGNRGCSLVNKRYDSL